MSLTAAGVSRGTSMAVATRRASADWHSSMPADGSSLRSVSTQSTLADPMLSARYSTMASVSGSAQCRSSRTSNPPAWPGWVSSRSTASPTTTGST